MTVASWVVKGDVIVADQGTDTFLGSDKEIVHHGLADHPVVRAAMWRGDVQAVVNAVRIAHEKSWCYVGWWHVNPDGRVMSGRAVMTRDGLRDVNGWMIDTVVKLYESRGPVGGNPRSLPIGSRNDAPDFVARRDQWVDECAELIR